MGKRDGFTMVEIMLVALIVTILAVALLLLLNPAQQRKRIWDVQRKRELEQLRILYETYFAENLEYPTAEKVCYDDATIENDVCSCHICGLERDQGTFASVLKLLYCDPEHGKKDYLYKYDCANPFPMWYVIYAQLDTGPGPASGLTCNYAVSNDPTKIESNPPGCRVSSGGGPGQPTPTPNYPACPNDPVPKYCKQSGDCNICHDFLNCSNPVACDQAEGLFTDDLCVNRCSH